GLVVGLYTLDAEDQLSEIAAVSGDVFTAVPGGACLWCTGFLTHKKLDGSWRGEPLLFENNAYRAEGPADGRFRHQQLRGPTQTTQTTQTNSACLARTRVPVT